MQINDFAFFKITFSGIVGEVEELTNGKTNYYIWTHKRFDIGYNGKYIVDVNLTSEDKQKLELNAKVRFTYEVNWKPSPVSFRDRFDKYLDHNFFQHRVCVLSYDLWLQKWLHLHIKNFSSFF